MKRNKTGKILCWLLCFVLAAGVGVATFFCVENAETIKHAFAEGWENFKQIFETDPVKTPEEQTPSEQTPEEHVHAYLEWTQTLAPTCIEAGTEERVCACGEKEIRGIPALGHVLSSDFIVVEEPTQFANGFEVSYCSVCGVECERNVLPALGLDYTGSYVLFPTNDSGLKILTVSNLSLNFNAAVDEDGVYFMLVDGFDFSEYSVNIDCENEQMVLVKEIEYASDVKTTYEIRVSSDGSVIVLICSNDNSSDLRIEGEKLDYVPSLHSCEFDDDWTLIKPLSCCEVGVEQRVCKYCGLIEERNAGMLEHDFSIEVVDVESSCNEPGQGHFECSYCGLIGSNFEIPKLTHEEHSFVVTQRSVSPIFTDKPGYDDCCHKVTIFYECECGETKVEFVEEEHDYDEYGHCDSCHFDSMIGNISSDYLFEGYFRGMEADVYLVVYNGTLSLYDYDDNLDWGEKLIPIYENICFSVTQIDLTNFIIECTNGEVFRFDNQGDLTVESSSVLDGTVYLVTKLHKVGIGV